MLFYTLNHLVIFERNQIKGKKYSYVIFVFITFGGYLFSFFPELVKEESKQYWSLDCLHTGLFGGTNVQWHA